MKKHFTVFIGITMLAIAVVIVIQTVDFRSVGLQGNVGLQGDVANPPPDCSSLQTCNVTHCGDQRPVGYRFKCCEKDLYSEIKCPPVYTHPYFDKPILFQTAGEVRGNSQILPDGPTDCRFGETACGSRHVHKGTYFQLCCRALTHSCNTKENDCIPHPKSPLPPSPEEK